MARTSKTGGRRVLAAERSRDALELRKQGLSTRKIAQRLGIAPSRASKILREAMDQLAEESRATAEARRALDLARLDEMLEAVWADAIAGDRTAIDRVLAIIDRRGRLLGTAAPSHVVVDWRDPNVWRGLLANEHIAMQAVEALTRVLAAELGEDVDADLPALPPGHTAESLRGYPSADDVLARYEREFSSDD
jgi:predicted transcriptional regulator